MIAATRHRTIVIDLPALHPTQEIVARQQSRFIVLAAGRRWGKTKLGVVLSLREALSGPRIVWWVAPSYKIAEVGWRSIRQLSAQIPGAVVKEGEKLVELPTGGCLQVRSGDDPNSLRGEGLDYIVLDEFSYMKPEVWQEVIRPALSDKLGRALFISTPRGRNLFWQLYQNGLDPSQTVWRSLHFTTFDNPFVRPEEIELARQQLPERVFRQEYLAEFIEDGGAVFRNVENCSTLLSLSPAEICSSHSNHRLILGVDWGKHEDYTVFSLLCADCRQQLYIDRSNRVEYQFQLKRLCGLLQDLGGLQRVFVVAERNAMGDPLIEQLQRLGIRVESFLMTASSKPSLIENLVLALERQELQLLRDSVQMAELQSFSMELNRVTNRPTYSAPPGMHDDTVVALALAWHGVTNGGGNLGIIFL